MSESRNYAVGPRNGNWKGGRSVLKTGYVLVVTKDGQKYEHILVAEKAIGHELPPKAEVHHFDENRQNNEPTNLVVCENNGYHRILHSRQEVLRRGGDPRQQKICRKCDALKSRDDFSSNKRCYDGLDRWCKVCRRERSVAWWLNSGRQSRKHRSGREEVGVTG